MWTQELIITFEKLKQLTFLELFDANSLIGDFNNELTILLVQVDLQIDIIAHWVLNRIANKIEDALLKPAWVANYVFRQSGAVVVVLEQERVIQIVSFHFLQVLIDLVELICDTRDVCVVLVFKLRYQSKLDPLELRLIISNLLNFIEQLFQIEWDVVPLEELLI